MHTPDISDLIEQFPIDRGFGPILKHSLKILDAIWHYPIFMADKKNPIAFSNIIVAIILFYLGVRISKSLSRLIRKRFTNIIKLQHNASSAIEKISYYLLLTLSTFIVLDVANVPLTAFTFVGGALAIGLGFGSQNIINNFISGLIIMIEQPIRIGDVVEMDNFTGIINNIGARCTHIVTFDNIDIIIPNSKLLENTIINFTLSENGKCRQKHDFKIYHTNDLNLVKEILLETIRSHPAVFKDPEPSVYLESIKDFYANFKIQYWIDISYEVSNNKIIDYLYFTISKEFEKNNIQMDYSTFDQIEMILNGRNSST